MPKFDIKTLHLLSLVVYFFLVKEPEVLVSVLREENTCSNK